MRSSMLIGLVAGVAVAASAKCGSRSEYGVSVTSTNPYTLRVSRGKEAIVKDIKILTGDDASTAYDAAPVSASQSGVVAHGRGHIKADFITKSVLKIDVDTADTAAYVGAQLLSEENATTYGVWSYPWDGSLSNEAVSFELKGLMEERGVNYCNARAPFYLSSSGYGVYVDTLKMGTFDFSQPDSSRFVFNTSSLAVYVVLPQSPGDIKSVMTQFGSLSSTIYMPPDSAFGPIIFSDDFEQDFHGWVADAAENYFDVVDHLVANRIRASAMFADRPYGTGNGSWGNFDFNLTAYPDPRAFIANLTAWGFDFQVWVSNRATPDTLMWNESLANGWQFDVDLAQLLGGLAGPALNLSIPAAYDWLASEMEYFPDVGVKGYKVDRGEENEMPVWEQNIQQDRMLKLTYDNMASKWGEGSFYNFARSANDRSRSHAAVWGGDSHANFTGLAYSVTAGIRAGLVGFAMWGSDTGGYVRKADEQIPPATRQPPTEEVWARWMHFATFSPMYELMLGTGATPWYDYTSDLVAVFAETAALHHELLPYIRSYTYAAHKTGLPVMRPLFLEEPADPVAWSETADLEYFFGAELLVAPIVTEGGTRDVYFPGTKDVKYVDYTTKKDVHAGGETVSVSMGVHDVPVYVRAGSIVPRGDVVRANDRWTEDWAPWLNIEVFPSFAVKHSRFEYYDRETGKVVEFEMNAFEKTGAVEVRYGATGFSGSVVFYTADGTKKIALEPRGGVARLEDVKSLFEQDGVAKHAMVY